MKQDLYFSAESGLIVPGQSHFFDMGAAPVRTVDLGGDLVSPGLIDCQINGAYGIDFSELSLEDADGGEERYLTGLELVARRIVETGCTSFVPTIITQKEELYAKVSSRATHIDRYSVDLQLTRYRSYYDCSAPGHPNHPPMCLDTMPKDLSSIHFDEVLTPKPC